MRDANTGESQETSAPAKPLGQLLAPKAAKYSVIAPTVCWVVLVLAIILKVDLYKVAFIPQALFVIAITSLVAGFIGLCGANKLPITLIAVAGMLHSAFFGFCDYAVSLFSGMGHGC